METTDFRDHGELLAAPRCRDIEQLSAHRLARNHDGIDRLPLSPVRGHRGAVVEVLKRRGDRPTIVEVDPSPIVHP